MIVCVGVVISKQLTNDAKLIKNNAYLIVTIWAPSWHPFCPFGAGGQSRRWSASAPAAPR